MAPASALHQARCWDRICQAIGPCRAKVAGLDEAGFLADNKAQDGVMPPERLFESPFTDVSAQGPLGVFPPTQVTRIVSTLKEIRTRAVA